MERRPKSYWTRFVRPYASSTTPSAPKRLTSYVGWITRYILFHNKRHPREMGVSEIEAFLTYLAVDQHVAASTQNQALSALLFLYREVLKKDLERLIDSVRAKRPKRLPTVLIK